MYGLHLDFQVYKEQFWFYTIHLSMQMHTTAKDCMAGYPYGSQD